MSIQAATRRAHRPGVAAFLPPTKEQQELIEVAFAAVQAKDEAHIDYYAAKAALKALGFDVKKRELLQAIEQSCPMCPCGSQISLEEFAHISMRYFARISPEDQISYSFSMFDEEKKGYIDMADLRRVSRNVLGEAAPESDLKAMMAMHDSSRQYRVHPAEFALIYASMQ